jgi:predicted DCC family thiol-disulfide oxidoreductase YuxK
MKPSFLAAALVCVAAASAFAATLPAGYDDNPSVIEAVAKAKTSGKPVVVYFAEQNCPVCDAHDGWLVRADVRQAYKDAYHFAIVYGDDMVPEERARWKATYVPRGAPSWVVLDSEGGYVCTSSGGFASATAALDLHKVLSKALGARNASAASFSKVSDGPVKSRPCTERSLGTTPSST